MSIAIVSSNDSIISIYSQFSVHSFLHSFLTNFVDSNVILRRGGKLKSHNFDKLHPFHSRLTLYEQSCPSLSHLVPLLIRASFFNYRVSSIHPAVCFVPLQVSFSVIKMLIGTRSTHRTISFNLFIHVI